MSRDIQEVKDGLTLEKQIKQTLIDTANATTGKTDTDLTSAVGSLVEGFGQGGEPDEELVKQAELLFISSRVDLSQTDITELEMDCANKTSFQYFVQSCIILERVKVTNTGKVSNWYFAFASCPKLTSLETLDFSSATNLSNAFRCDNVTHFRVVPNTLKISANFSYWSKLDEASIQSIIDGLADLTGQTAQTLTLHADVKAKLTETQIATITSKNWTLA